MGVKNMACEQWSEQAQELKTALELIGLDQISSPNNLIISKLPDHFDSLTSDQASELIATMRSLQFRGRIYQVEDPVEHPINFSSILGVLRSG